MEHSHIKMYNIDTDRGAGRSVRVRIIFGGCRLGQKEHPFVRISQ